MASEARSLLGGDTDDSEGETKEERDPYDRELVSSKLPLGVWLLEKTCLCNRCYPNTRYGMNVLDISCSDDKSCPVTSVVNHLYSTIYERSSIHLLVYGQDFVLQSMQIVITPHVRVQISKMACACGPGS